MARQNSWRSSISTVTWLRVERSRFRLPVGADDYTDSTTSPSYVKRNVITVPVGQSGCDLKLPTYLHLVPKFRISRAIPLLLHMPSWLMREQLDPHGKKEFLWICGGTRFVWKRWRYLLFGFRSLHVNRDAKTLVLPTSPVRYSYLLTSHTWILRRGKCGSTYWHFKYHVLELEKLVISMGS